MWERNPLPFLRSLEGPENAIPHAEYKRRGRVSPSPQSHGSQATENLSNGEAAHAGSAYSGLQPTPVDPRRAVCRDMRPILGGGRGYSLLRAPLHATPTPTSSTPLTSPTTSSPPMAHERASSTLLKVVAFASPLSTFEYGMFAIWYQP